MDKFSTYFWIGLGSALGGVGRYFLSGLIAQRFGETFPWGTLLVNVSGSFAIGFLAALTRPEGRIFISSTAQQFLMVGLLGGYTTFSSFSLQTLNLARDGQWLYAGVNVLLSIVICLAAVGLGNLLGQGLNR